MSSEVVNEQRTYADIFRSLVEHSRRGINLAGVSTNRGTMVSLIPDMDSTIDKRYTFFEPETHFGQEFFSGTQKKNIGNCQKCPTYDAGLGCHRTTAVGTIAVLI